MAPTYSLQFTWGYDPGAGLSVPPGPAVPQPRAERGEEHGGQPVQEDRGHPPCKDQDHGAVSHMIKWDETIINQVNIQNLSMCIMMIQISNVKLPVHNTNS